MKQRSTPARELLFLLGFIAFFALLLSLAHAFMPQYDKTKTIVLAAVISAVAFTVFRGILARRA